MPSMTESVFIGIDLAWGETNPSGWAVLKGDQRCAELVEVNTLPSCEAVLARLKDHATASIVVAIDAPLIISNEKGQRRCETEIGRCYGAKGASCHSSNLSHCHPAGVRLASQLESLGFRHAPDLAHPENQRVMLEVYPHPALIELFRLRSIIKYKKGKVASRRKGQGDLQQRLRELSRFTRPLACTPSLSEFLATQTKALRGAALKANEDKLDAIMCAYIAYHWFWRRPCIRTFGDLASGYIVVPTLSTPAASRRALPAPS